MGHRGGPELIAYVHFVAGKVSTAPDASIVATSVSAPGT